MGAHRQSIVEAAEQMRSVTSTISEIMRISYRSEIRHSGKVQIESYIHSLEDCCPELYHTLMNAALSLRDDWPVIETNKARLRETGTFFDEYQKFKAEVLEFDDWRCTCYEGQDIFPEAHQIAMSLVLLCGKCDSELNMMRAMIEELKTGSPSIDDHLMKFEEAMKEFCDIPNDGYLIEQIRFTREHVFKAVWRGAKNELTFFADWFRKDSGQIRMIFGFPEDKKTKYPFEISKHPADKLPENNRLKLLLKNYPREKFFK